MAGDRIKVAELTDAQVQKLHALEQETGKLLVAYEPRHSFAELTPEELAKIKAAEQELGVVLLAYQRSG